MDDLCSDMLIVMFLDVGCAVSHEYVGEMLKRGWHHGIMS